MKIAVLCNSIEEDNFSVEFKKHMDKYYDIDIIPNMKNKRTGTFGRILYEENKFGKYDALFNLSGFAMSHWCNKERKRHKTPFVIRAYNNGRFEFLNRMYKPDQMVFLSNHHRNQICYWGKTIYDAIDLESMQTTQKSTLVQNLEPPIVLSTSKLIGSSRIESTIEAMYRFGRGTLVQTSDGKQKDSILKKGQKLLNERFVYVGKLPKEQSVSLYNGCDIFVDASKCNSTNVNYLEAMASNLPVVTQEDPSRREVIGIAGLLGNLEDTTYFANLLNRASRIKWGKAPSEQAKRFNWETVIKQYKKIFDDLNSESSGD